jgi:hypothetical protein
MFAAKVKDLLRFSDTSDVRAREAATFDYKECGTELDNVLQSDTFISNLIYSLVQIEFV